VLGQSKYEQRYKELEKQARRDMPKALLHRSADVRYTGQSYELTIPWGGDFHAAHAKEYGYSDRARTTEIVTLRLRAVLPVPRLSIRATARAATRKPVAGPALVADYGSTTYVPKGWKYVADEMGNLIVSR
jgi:N-methylhydantoinase A